MGDPRPLLCGQWTIDQLIEEYYDKVLPALARGVMMIDNIADLTTRLVATMVVQIVGDAPHRITGGVILLLEQAMGGTRYC